jgi:hypothetical protein
MIILIKYFRAFFSIFGVNGLIGWYLGGGSVFWWFLVDSWGGI